jgi:hypothetical protein
MTRTTGRRRRVEAYVYLVGVAADGCYKIGWSGNPEQRLVALRSQAEDRGLRLLHVIGTRDGTWLERYLHLAFDHRRRHRHGHGSREWFRLSPGEVALVKTLGDITDPDGVPVRVRHLFESNDSFGLRRFRDHVENVRQAAIREVEAGELVEALPGLVARAERGGAPPARLLRRWLAKSRTLEKLPLLRLTLHKLQVKVSWLRPWVWFGAHPGGPDTLPDAVEEVARLGKQMGRREEAMEALRRPFGCPGI